MKYSFVFPVWNEEKCLRKQIYKFYKQITELKICSYEILLVENGSWDKTWKIIKSLQNKIPEIKGLRINGSSYGRAVRHGLLSAQGKYIFVFNVDFYDIEFVKSTLLKLKTNSLIVGSKTIDGSCDNRKIQEKLRTKIFCYCLKKMLKYPGTDTHGLKVFTNNDNFKKILLKCNCVNEFFDTELLIKLNKSGESLCELPVRVENIRTSRYFGFKRIKGMVIDLYRICFSSILHDYELTVDIIGADDYGLSNLVNQAIKDQVKSKTVNVVSLLPNFTNVNDFKNFNNFSAHINLVRGIPVSPIQNVKSLVDKNGIFFPTPIFLIKLFFRRIKLDEIETEIRNQMLKLKNIGFDIKFIDSEQHMHIFSPINRLIYNISNDFEIDYIRSEKSTVNALIKKPIRLIVFTIFYYLLRFVYWDNVPVQKQIDVLITHPGSNFD